MNHQRSAPVDIHETVEQLHQAATDAFCEAVDQTLALSDLFRVSLSGGSTPKRLYELLAERDLPWHRIHWFWGDERNVPSDHADCNARMVREALLDRVDIPSTNVHTVAVDIEQPAAAAKAYEQVIRKYFPGDAFPKWDLVLLGMGDDGHTASLFPHTKALKNSEDWFVENWVEKFDAFRYTLTAPAINSGKRIWFLLAGQGKRQSLEQVWSDTEAADTYPSQLIQPTRWIVTRDTIANK